jgi:hypothetical protein
MSSSVKGIYEEVVDEILASWTALDLAIGHYDGQLRDAHEKRQVLLEAISDAVSEDRYEVQDIAEFINEYMYENFFMELDDESHIGVARVCIDAWNMCKTGQRPVVAKRASGSSCSVIKDDSEEIDEDAEMADSHMDEEPSSNHCNRPHVVTDEDGWSTVVPRKQ